MPTNESEHLASYEHPVGSAIGSCLLAVGLYTGIFESIVRLMRVAVMEYLKKTESDDRERQLDNLYGNENADAAIRFCAPYLLQAAVITRKDVKFLHKVRQYRNELVHRAIDRGFVAPSLSDVSSDVRRLIDIAHAVEQWTRSHWTPPAAGKVRVAIYWPGLLESCLAVATELADNNLSSPG